MAPMPWGDGPGAGSTAASSKPAHSGQRSVSMSTANTAAGDAGDVASMCTTWFMYQMVQCPTVTRNDLLAAIVEHLRREGLGDQSLRSIATAVGTSHRMLVYHFGSKDALLA